MNRLTAGLLALSLTGGAMAAGGDVPLEHAKTDIGNVAALQRGAATYMNYCAGCHSMEYMRYSRLMEDLELTEEQVVENLIFDNSK
ncbi:MAG: cytochrome c1, partial [Pseudomonadota bacterium]